MSAIVARLRESVIPPDDVVPAGKTLQPVIDAFSARVYSAKGARKPASRGPSESPRG
jgi:hypothetical protein